MAKECGDSEESETADESEKILKVAELDNQNVNIENNVSVEEEAEVRGNYSKASADKLWKDIK